MQQRNGMIELRRDRRAARCREMHSAEAVSTHVAMRMLLRIYDRRESEKGSGCGERCEFHRNSLLPYCAVRNTAQQVFTGDDN